MDKFLIEPPVRIRTQGEFCAAHYLVNNNLAKEGVVEVVNQNCIVGKYRARKYLIDKGITPDVSFGHRYGRAREVFAPSIGKRSPFEYLESEIGGFDEVLRTGSFFSFEELSCIVKPRLFINYPIYIPMLVCHSTFDRNYQLCLMKVLDTPTRYSRGGKQYIRRCVWTMYSNTQVIEEYEDGMICLRKKLATSETGAMIPSLVA